MIDTIYLAGILMGLLAALLFNYAPVLQKMALNAMPPSSDLSFGEQIKAMATSKKWMLGFMFGFLGAIPFALALIWVGVTIVQPLMGFGLLVLVYFSKKQLNEELSLILKFGIVLLILMPILLTFADVTPPARSILDSDFQLVLLILMVVVIFVCAGLYLVSKKLPIFYGIIAGIGFALGASLIQAGLDLIELTGYTLFDDIFLVIADLFTTSQLQISVGILIVGQVYNFVGVYLLQVGAQQIDASKYMPVSNTINVIASVFIGLWLFQQAIGNLLLYLLGLACAIAGTIILTYYSKTAEEITELVDK